MKALAEYDEKIGATPAADAPPPEPTQTPNTDISQKTLSEDEHVSIMPNVGFVIKSKRTVDGGKIFINVFYHKNVAAMMATPERISHDKSGSECVVYDLVVPETLFMDSIHDEAARNEVCLDAINLVNTNYENCLGTDYILPKMKKGYVGDKVEPMDIPASFLLGELMQD